MRGLTCAFHFSLFTFHARCRLSMARAAYCSTRTRTSTPAVGCRQRAGLTAGSAPASNARSTGGRIAEMNPGRSAASHRRSIISPTAPLLEMDEVAPFAEERASGSGR